MKYFYYLLAAAGLAITSWATQIQEKPLEQRLRGAHHIVIGMATKLEVLDQNGTVLSDLKADATGLRCRLTVEIEKNINSSDIPLPKSITVTYQNKWHKTIESETKSFVGKKMIYLLKGKDFAPVDHFQFVESVENADKIRELIEAQKKDK